MKPRYELPKYIRSSVTEQQFQLLSPDRETIKIKVISGTTVHANSITVPPILLDYEYTQCLPRD